jgi:hypothetical protein
MSAEPIKKKSKLGYDHIEELIETEQFDGINKSFSDAYDKLETLMKDATAPLKKKKGAQKAIKSYELTVELINELLIIKKEMLKHREQEAKKQKK